MAVNTAEVATPDALVTRPYSRHRQSPACACRRCGKRHRRAADRIAACIFHRRDQAIRKGCIDRRALRRSAGCRNRRRRSRRIGQREIRVSCNSSHRRRDSISPAVPLAVNTAEVATPDALVTAVFTPPAKTPLAPAAGDGKRHRRAADRITASILYRARQRRFPKSCVDRRALRRSAGCRNRAAGSRRIRQGEIAPLSRLRSPKR